MQIESIAYSLNSALLKVKGLGEAKVAKMKDAAAKLVPMGFTTAAEYHKHRQELIQVEQSSDEISEKSI
jgi:DNA repair protein RAD51